MKKRKLFLLAMTICLMMCIGALFAGCSRTPGGSKIGTEYKVGNIVLEKIETSNYFDLYVEKKTRIVYIYSTETHKGGISVLYNKEGKPMTYDEYKKMSR